MSEKATGRESDKFMLRLPDGMRDGLKRAAAANGRSMNAEVVARLEASLSDSQKSETNPAQLAEMGARAAIAAFVDEMLHLPSNAPVSILIERLRKNATPKD